MTEHAPLVSTDWLRAHIGDRDLVILDASVFLDAMSASGRPEFRSGLAKFENDGRIPQSRFADLFFDFSDASSGLPFTRPKQKQFELSAARSGITPSTRVVVYDRLIGQWAARLWWVFKTFGHERVSVLDGGFKKWIAEGGAVESGSVWPYEARTYTARNYPALVAEHADILRVIDGSDRASLICLLPRDDFAGEIQVRARAGHIPGSANLPFKTLVDPATNAMRSSLELRVAFEAVVPLDGRRIITYCGAGVASTLGALALASIGYTNSAEYDGSLAEWVLHPDLPIEVGAGRANA